MVLWILAMADTVELPEVQLDSSSIVIMLIMEKYL